MKKRYELKKKLCKGCTPEKPLADSVACLYCPYIKELEELKVEE